MGERFAKELEVILHFCVKHAFHDDSLHLFCGQTRLVVVVARHEAPRNVVAIHDVEEFFEVVVPEIILLLRSIVHLARDEVAGNSHEVRLLLPNYLLNHMDGAAVALLVFSKVQVSQLHDAQLPFAVDL